MITYGDKALEAINATDQTEEGMSDAEWAAKKRTCIGTAIGTWAWATAWKENTARPIKSLQRRPADAQRERAAPGRVPLLSGIGQLQLGQSDRRRGQMRQGMQFFQQSAAISNPMQDQASRNAKLVLDELGGR